MSLSRKVVGGQWSSLVHMGLLLKSYDSNSEFYDSFRSQGILVISIERIPFIGESWDSGVKYYDLTLDL